MHKKLQKNIGIGRVPNSLTTLILLHNPHYYLNWIMQHYPIKSQLFYFNAKTVNSALRIDASMNKYHYNIFWHMDVAVKIMRKKSNSKNRLTNHQIENEQLIKDATEKLPEFLSDDRFLDIILSSKKPTLTIDPQKLFDHLSSIHFETTKSCSLQTIDDAYNQASSTTLCYAAGLILRTISYPLPNSILNIQVLFEKLLIKLAEHNISTEHPSIHLVYQAYITRLLIDNSYEKAIALFNKHYGYIYRPSDTETHPKYDLHGLNEGTAFLATLLITLRQHKRNQAFKIIVGSRGFGVLRHGAATALTTLKTNHRLSYSEINISDTSIKTGSIPLVIINESTLRKAIDQQWHTDRTHLQIKMQFLRTRQSIVSLRKQEIKYLYGYFIGVINYLNAQKSLIITQIAHTLISQHKQFLSETQKKHQLYLPKLKLFDLENQHRDAIDQDEQTAREKLRVAHLKIQLGPESRWKTTKQKLHKLLTEKNLCLDEILTEHYRFLSSLEPIKAASNTATISRLPRTLQRSFFSKLLQQCNKLYDDTSDQRPITPSNNKKLVQRILKEALIKNEIPTWISTHKDLIAGMIIITLWSAILIAWQYLQIQPQTANYHEHSLLCTKIYAEKHRPKL